MPRLPALALLLITLTGCSGGGSSDDHLRAGPQGPQNPSTQMIDPNGEPGKTVDAKGAAAEAAYLVALARHLPHLRQSRSARLGYGYSACSLREQGLPGESFRGSLIRAGLSPEEEAVLVTMAQTRLCPEQPGDRS